MSVPTVEDWLKPQARLKRNRERLHEVQKFIRLLEEQREFWNPMDRRLHEGFVAEHKQLSAERLLLTKIVLGILPQSMLCETPKRGRNARFPHARVD